MKDKPVNTKKKPAPRRLKKSHAAASKKIGDGSRVAATLQDDYYRSLFENAQVGIFRSRIDGSAIIEVNKKLCDIFGFTREEMLSNPATIRWADQVKRAGMIKRVSAEGSVSDYEVPIVTKSGEVRTCLVSISMDAESGTIEGSAVDITGLRRAEEALLDTEERFRATFEQAAVGMAQVGIDGRWLRVNQRLCDIVGYTHEELLRLTFQDITHPEDLNADLAYVQQVLSGDLQTYSMEKRYIRKNRSVIWVNLTVSLVRGMAGDPRYFISVVEDINDRKRAEMALQKQKEELGAANEELMAAEEELRVQLDDLIAKQQELLESEKKYRDTVKYLDEGYYRCAVDGLLLEHNLAFNEILGFDSDKDLKGNKLPDFWQNPDDRKEYLNVLMANGTIRNYMINAKKAGGEKLVVLASSHLLKDEAGRVTGIVGTFTDFTDRRRIEEALKINQERILFATEGANLGIWNWDIVTGELVWSDKCRELFGIPLDETMSYPRFSDALHPDDRERTDKAVKDALDNHKDFDIEYRSIWPDESIHWLTAKGRGFYDATGKAVRLEGIVLDISERKRADEELRKAKENLEQRVKERTADLERSKQLLNETGMLARVGGWEIDLRENKLTWTDTVYRIHEVGPEFLPTIEAGINFYAPEAVPVISGAVRRAIEEGLPFDLELQLITAKQKRIWVRAIGEARRENGEIVKVGGVLQDINARKLADEELARRANELEAANLELEAFSYSVSHDLRAPLRSIDGFSQAVLEDYGGMLDDKGKDYLGRIRAASQRMGRLIDDILKLSRITRSEMRLMPVDLSEIARGFAAEMKAANPERDATFIIADAVIVNGDTALLRVVMENLLSNAWKFTGKHPRSVIEFGAADIAGERTLYIRDDGAGFDMEYADKLFGAFQRLHADSDFAGTGIGLTLTKRIILRHGGRIWAEAVVENGATIWFTVGQ